MSLAERITGLVGRDGPRDDEPRYRCENCGERYEYPTTPCENCGGSILTRTT